MKLTEHFSLEELTTTQHREIDNTPTEHAMEYLKILAEVLEEVRLFLGVAIHISSAYRCPDLNEAIGGARNSRHMLGLAADFIAPDYGTPLKICHAINDSELMFDQLIYEYGRWVHFGLAEPNTNPRRQVLHILNRQTGYISGLPEEIK